MVRTKPARSNLSLILFPSAFVAVVAVSLRAPEKTERFERIRRMTCDFHLSPASEHRGAVRLAVPKPTESRVSASIRNNIPVERSITRDEAMVGSLRFDAITGRPSPANELIIVARGTVLYLRYLPRIYDASCLPPANTRLSVQYVITNEPCNRPLISSPSRNAISLPEMHFLY